MGRQLRVTLAPSPLPIVSRMYPQLQQPEVSALGDPLFRGCFESGCSVHERLSGGLAPFLNLTFTGWLLTAPYLASNLRHFSSGCTTRWSAPRQQRPTAPNGASANRTGRAAKAASGTQTQRASLLEAGAVIQSSGARDSTDEDTHAANRPVRIWRRLWAASV